MIGSFELLLLFNYTSGCHLVQLGWLEYGSSLNIRVNHIPLFGGFVIQLSVIMEVERIPE
jgi:hypothetical protein